MIIEVCTEDLAQSMAAQQWGAERIELCADLHNGGTTPSAGMIRIISERCQVKVFVMIRPRGGDFCYSPAEIEIMEADIRAAAGCGAAGVVFGALTESGLFCPDTNKRLVSVAKEYGLGTTFHRAIDVCPKPFDTLNALIDHGFDQVLTSGGANTAEEGILQIEQMVTIAAGRIKIMAGAGVKPGNVNRIMKAGVQAIHFTARKHAEINERAMGTHWIPDHDKLNSIAAEVSNYIHSGPK